MILIWKQLFECGWRSCLVCSFSTILSMCMLTVKRRKPHSDSLYQFWMRSLWRERAKRHEPHKMVKSHTCQKLTDMPYSMPTPTTGYRHLILYCVLWLERVGWLWGTSTRWRTDSTCIGHMYLYLPLCGQGLWPTQSRALKEQGSWVVNRGADALEKMGLNTFIGYLHRAL